MKNRTMQPAQPAGVSLGEISVASEHGRDSGIVRFAAGLLAAALILAGLYFGRDILIPVALAILVAFVLLPAVTWLTRRGLPRILSTAIVMTVVMLLLAGFGLLLVTQARSLAAQFPDYQATMQAKVRDLRQTISAPGVFDRARETLAGIQQEVEQAEAEQIPTVQKVDVVGDEPSAIQEALSWVAKAGAPLATVGIIFLLAFLILLDSRDLRDRLLRLAGSDLHRSTDSTSEAGARVSSYLLMQLTVNGSYGIPMGVGLWLIGVPGALLWGTVAAVMRFVPYVGPLIAAAFPVALAFAVDDGWSMVLWTLGLILALELISNNVVEPLLYGTSTGLSAISLIVAAMFWTALWGPMGLVLSTPLTVCLLVLGRNVSHLRFLDILLGSSQVLDLPSRLYQRLIANDTEEAVEIAEEAIDEGSVLHFYSDHGVALLQLASAQYHGNATAEHRLRLSNGMDFMLDAIRSDHAAEAGVTASLPRVLCLGGKWDIDALAAQMLAHALELEGIPARALPAATLSSSYIARLDLEGVEVLCVGYFSPDPGLAAKHFIRRLQMYKPGLHVVVGTWSAPPQLPGVTLGSALPAPAVVATIEEAVARIRELTSVEITAADADAAERLTDPERLTALEESRLGEASLRELLDALAKRAADVFHGDMALVSILRADKEQFVGCSGKACAELMADPGQPLSVPLRDAPGAELATSDGAVIARDVCRHPRLNSNELLRRLEARFYAAAPLRTREGRLLGALAILANEPREFSGQETRLLESMAADALESLGEDVEAASASSEQPGSSATLGQRLPE